MKKYIVTLSLLAAGLVLAMPAHSQSKEKLIYTHTFAPGEGLVNRTEKEFRKEICLNGSWEFQPQALPGSYTPGKGVAPELTGPDATSWSKTPIKIPSPWNINAFANRGLEGPDHRNYPSYPKEWEEVRMAWMRRSVTVPADWSDKQIKLYFEAVSGYAEVYVNDQKVAENFDIFLPFEADITELVQPGETFEVRVGVRDQALFEDRSTIGRRIIPAGSMWGYMIRGIWQDVYLLALPKIHVEDVFVKPLVSKNLLELEVTIQNNTARKEEVQLQGVIHEWLNLAGTDVNSAPVPAWELGKKTLDVTAARLTVEAGANGTVTLQIPVNEGVLRYWTPDHPNLYSLLLSLHKKKRDSR